MTAFVNGFPLRRTPLAAILLWNFDRLRLAGHAALKTLKAYPLLLDASYATVVLSIRKVMAEESVVCVAKTVYALFSFYFHSVLPLWPVSGLRRFPPPPKVECRSAAS
jgi:hypothetical protein